jgi:hypothetical protein
MRNKKNGFEVEKTVGKNRQKKLRLGVWRPQTGKKRKR